MNVTKEYVVHLWHHWKLGCSWMYSWVQSLNLLLSRYRLGLGCSWYEFSFDGVQVYCLDSSLVRTAGGSVNWDIINDVDELFDTVVTLLTQRQAATTQMRKSIFQHQTELTDSLLFSELGYILFQSSCLFCLNSFLQNKGCSSTATVCSISSNK